MEPPCFPRRAEVILGAEVIPSLGIWGDSHRGREKIPQG